MNSKTNIVKMVYIKCYTFIIDILSKKPFKLVNKSILLEIKTREYNNYISFKEIIILNDYHVISTS